MLFTQLFINGLQTGALYALIAAGFSLIFGMTRIFHAAHGATFTIAGYIFYECYSVLHLSWPVAALAATFAASLFGVLLDRYVYAIIQRHEGSFFTVFVASFGMAIIVQNLIAMIFDRGAVTVSTRSIP
jgi:branched-chain amino acid transport system permease protein